MFKLIRWIRRWLEQKFLRSLGLLKDGFLVFCQSEETNPTLQVCSLEVERYFLGLFPIFCVKSQECITAHEHIASLQVLEEGFLAIGRDIQGGPELKRCTMKVVRRLGGVLPLFKLREHEAVSLSEVLSRAIQASKATLIEELEKTPATVASHAENYLAHSTKQRVGRTRVKSLEEIERRFSEFNNQVLLALIRSDRNTFRQLLLEQLSEAAAAIFANIVKKYLAELVLRTRQECAQEGLVDTVNEDTAAQLALPTGTRFFRKKGRMTLFVIEQPPRKRTIQTIMTSEAPVERYELSFPFVIFFAVLDGRTFHKLHVFFRKEPLRTAQDLLLCPSLSNIFEDFNVCFYQASPATAETLARTAENALESFWGGKFNLSHATRHYGHISLKDWERQSKKDALFGISYAWKDSQHTVAEVMEYIANEFKDQKQKKRASEGVTLSNLEKCVERLTSSIVQEIQETCFFLIPKWSIEEATLQDVTARFKETAEEVCLLLRKELEEDIGGILSEKNLTRAFEKAIERTVESLRLNTETAIVAAREALLKLAKEEFDDSSTP